MRTPSGIDRWVLPPAVCAAAFALLAAAPLNNPVGECLLVEGIRVGEGGFWLLRGAWTTSGPGSEYRAPRELRFVAGREVVTARGAPGRLFAWAALPVDPRVTELVVRADGRGEQGVRVPTGRATVLSGAGGGPGMGLVVEGGALITEHTGVVLVYAPGAVALRMEPELDGVTVSPQRAEVDGCGVARFDVRVEALGAPVRVVVEPTGAVSRMNLPLRPGGISTRWNNGVFEARTAVGVGSVFVVGGTPRGVTVWDELRWEREGEGVLARWEAPPGVQWAMADNYLRFNDPSGLAREAFGDFPVCEGGDASRRWFAAIERLPVIPEVEVLFDGLARERDVMTQRSGKLRALSLAGLALSLMVEALLVLHTGLATDPVALKGVVESRRKRLGFVAAIVLTIAVAGMALAVNGWMNVR